MVFKNINIRCNNRNNFYSKDSIMEAFNLPISFLEEKNTTNKHLITDLELIENNDNIKEKKSKEIFEMEDVKLSMYEHIFNPVSKYSKKTIPLWSKYYTTNKTFILDSQELLKNKIPQPKINTEEVEKIWNDINNETDFYNKYKYLDNSWGFTKMLNTNSQFLQLLSIYNISSPILSLTIPILFLILPFFIIRMQGYNITPEKYKHVLKLVFRKHALGKLFNLGSADWGQRIYILISFGFYIFQTYQNFISCKIFYEHSKKINSQLKYSKEFIKEIVQSMDILEESCSTLESYTPFIENMRNHKKILISFMTMLNKENFDSKNIAKCLSMGNHLCCFNKLYNDNALTESLEYSLYLSGYLENLREIQDKINKKQICFCKISKNNTSFKNAYYPPHKLSTIKNSYSLKNNMLVTGPNASGKTTLLKTTLLNILITQQMGCGFYSSAKINPYDCIYSYLNIPDTSGRDSLFQAEARRCFNILNAITSNETNKNASKRYFCVFDEIFSGTNPYEAIGAAISYLKYLNNHKNMTFIVTTHFLDVCKHLESIKKIKNHNMKIIEKDNTFIYTYKLQKGISKIKGGVKVLKDLKYPKEIIDETIQIIKTLNI